MPRDVPHRSRSREEQVGNTSDPTRETHRAPDVKPAKQLPVGIRASVFTDKLGAPIARLADHTLPVAGENLLYSHSMAAFAVLAHGIATALAVADRELVLKRVREADRVARPQFVKGE